MCVCVCSCLHLCVCFRWVGPLNHGFWGPQVKRERDGYLLCTLGVTSTFLFNISTNSLLLRLVVCPGTQSVDWEELFLAVHLFLIPFVFCPCESTEGTPPPWEAGDFSALSVIISFALSFFFSFSSGFQSLPLTAIHRLHRPKLLDLSLLTTM